MKRRYWLFKSEPVTFSISDLRQSPKQTSLWDGVRNFQARNYLRDQVKIGDGVLFWHSSAEVIGIAGEAIVVKAGYPDPTQFDPKSEYYDPRSSKEKPLWYTVDVRFVRACKRIIARQRLEEFNKLLKMIVLRRGTRLSIQPVTPDEWNTIIALPGWLYSDASPPSSSSKLIKP